MDAAARMPGDAEAAAAIAGMHETYGRPEMPKLGAEHWFQSTVGAMPQPGRVVGLFDDGRILMAEPNGTTHEIRVSQIAEF